nr:30S ribosomal protein S17, small subunit ribosomal protein S17 [uncultured archaeon]
MAKKKAEENLEDKTEVKRKAEEKKPKQEKPTEKKGEVKCEDNFCPFHGTTKLHGRSLIGEVLSTKSHKTAKVVRERQYFLRKYERYEKRQTKIKVHNPTCINAKVGDLVRVVESRPLSKTKNFVIVEVLEKK